MPVGARCVVVVVVVVVAMVVEAKEDFIHGPLLFRLTSFNRPMSRRRVLSLRQSMRLPSVKAFIGIFETFKALPSGNEYGRPTGTSTERRNLLARVHWTHALAMRSRGALPVLVHVAWLSSSTLPRPGTLCFVSPSLVSPGCPNEKRTQRLFMPFESIMEKRVPWVTRRLLRRSESEEETGDEIHEECKNDYLCAMGARPEVLVKVLSGTTTVEITMVKLELVTSVKDAGMGSAVFLISEAIGPVSTTRVVPEGLLLGVHEAQSFKGLLMVVRTWWADKPALRV
ncbi:hypothetical protein BKA70DRAFT_1219432 [Coprinopsis sp. MPI-PUGE-AT-0042]|nr:hypothetical protein BKA70DRAFT_1219432 [Coprinopsis sp. MPI-PUGE-AT-0042]